MNPVRLEITDEAMADLRALPAPDLQRVALQWISRLRSNPRLGARLEWRWRQDLRGCRKVYFEKRDTPLQLDLVPRKRSEEGATHRIVYRLLPSDERPTLVQVFAVGAKYGPSGGVYARAAERYRLLLENGPVD